MSWLVNLSFSLNLLLLLITTLNVLTVRTIKTNEKSIINGKVSILIPLRNESDNVEGVLQSVLEQNDLLDFEVIALDDNSTDDTAVKLRDTTAANLKILNGGTLPEGWLGKNYACHQLTQHATGDYLVFVDADVRLAPNAVASSIQQMNMLHWDFISPYPRQIALSFLERLTQPLLQWSWFVSLPLRVAENLQRPSMVVANGQLLIIRREPYSKSGGHYAVKAEVLDDMELARSLIRNGFSGGVADGSKVAECRMYSTNRELIQGYTKSQWRAFSNPFGATLVIGVLLVTSVLPFLMGLLGQIVGWYAYFTIVMTRLLVAGKTKSVVSSAALHPLSAAFWIYLIVNSWLMKRNGELTWRGRKI